MDRHLPWVSLQGARLFAKISDRLCLFSDLSRVLDHHLADAPATALEIGAKSIGGHVAEGLCRLQLDKLWFSGYAATRSST